MLCMNWINMGLKGENTFTSREKVDELPPNDSCAVRMNGKCQINIEHIVQKRSTKLDRI